MGQIFVAFSEYLNFTTFIQSREFHLEIALAFEYSNPTGTGEISIFCMGHGA